MTRILLRVLLLTALLPVAAGAAGREDCLVIAHRGASGYLPEHTLAAYRLAIQLGADYIEPDLVLTRDGVLIARHENELGRSTDVAARPAFASRRTRRTVGDTELEGWFSEDFSLTEIRSLRAREPNPELRPGNRHFDGLLAVPALDEIIALLKAEERRTGRTIGLYPELKHPAHFRARGFDMERILVATLNRHDYGRPDDPVLIQSFDGDSLQRLRLLTGLRLVLLVGVPAADDPDRPAVPVDVAAVARYAHGLGIAKGLLVSDPALIAAARAAGLFLHGWTFRAENHYLAEPFRRGSDPAGTGDLAAEIRAALDAGLDGFFTDHPDVGRAVCDARRAGDGS